MIFSDEEIAKLKEVAEASLKLNDIPFYCSGSQITALLARLEAAELIVNSLDPEEVAQVHENFFAWLRAKGEGL